MLQILINTCKSLHISGYTIKSKDDRTLAFQDTVSSVAIKFETIILASSRRSAETAN